MCCRNFVPLMLRLLMPFGPSAARNGSLGLFDVPTLQLMSWLNMSCVPFGSLSNRVVVFALKSSCSRESTGWYMEHNAIFMRPLIFFPRLSRFLKCRWTPMKRPSCWCGSVNESFCSSASL